MFHTFFPLIPFTIAGALFFKKKSFAYALPVVLTLIKMLTTQISAVYLFIAAALLVSVFAVRRLKETWGSSVFSLAGYAAISVVLYELIANFGVWALAGCTTDDPMYAMNFRGLVQCYSAAISYSTYHFLRDIPVTIILVKVIELLGKIPALKTGKSQVQ